MPVIALQGICENTGTTVVTAGLAWALQTLGEAVLVIDFSPNNMLRLQFNTPWDNHKGWARALVDGTIWQESALRYIDNLDFLPFGNLSTKECTELETQLQKNPTFWQHALTELQASKKYKWILLDVASVDRFMAYQAYSLTNHSFLLLNTNANCHIRLHQQNIPEQSKILINKFNPVSRFQRDLHRLWLETQTNAIDLLIHQDEALAESPAKKQPIGDYAADSLAAEELITLANWCLINFAEERS